jgi:5-methyltetrahydrofolate--homocysteine methyltransferase
MTTLPRDVRQKAFHDLLATRIAVLDGAMGTMVHALGLDENGFRGEAFRDHPKDLKNCIDILVLTQGDAIRGIHAAYLEAGADIVETNTFGATALALADFGLEDRVRELNLAAAKLVFLTDAVPAGTAAAICAAVALASTVRPTNICFTSSRPRAST